MNMKTYLGATLPILVGQAVCGAPYALVVGEGFVDPLGFHDATPAFSWKLPEGVKRQAAYRIEVRDNQRQELAWDSGWIESDRSVGVPYGGSPLASRQQLAWRVQIRDDRGRELGWSEPARFELGLLASKDWEARWIRPPAKTPEPAPAFTLIKALYRSRAHPERGRDVTALLREKIKDNALSVTANNETMGGDPAYGQKKELVLAYQVGGKDETAILAENGTGVFPDAGQPAEEVAWLRRGFEVSGEIRQARLYVTARGVFEVRLNGEKVGNDHFANGWTSYSKRIDTLAYDVTGRLRQGDNALGAMLGTGWYAGRIGFKHQKGLFGRHPELLLQLEIAYQDGRTQTIASDGGWKATLDGPILSSSLYDGESYDARREMPGWDRPGFDDAGWGAVEAHADLGAARLVPKPFAPTRATEKLAVQTITEPEPGRFVFDLGQNLVGWARVKIPVEKDRTVTVRFAEMLNPDGTLYTENYRSAKSTDSYTAAKSGTTEWEPVFTFHGFRYVELSGLPAGAKPEKEWVAGVVLHSDLQPLGRFESSHEKLNQLQRNIIWGQRGNFLDIPTDCPQRDERLGWTGDAQVFGPTAMFNYDCHAFFKSWFGSMRDDQLPDGRVPHVVPSVVGAGSPGWQDAATIMPWDAYVRTGDLELLADNHPMMERLVGWYRSQSTNNVIPEITAFGDWLQPYAQHTSGDTPKPLLGTVFYAHSARILADTSRVLGKTAEAAQYAAEAAAVRQAFAAHYFDADGKLQNAPETQTAYLLAIAFDLVPPALQEKAAGHLVRLVDEAGGHLRTGFLGTPFIASVLDRIGRPDLAFSVLFKETYPSWFYSINQGATTMWERWNSYSHADGFGPVGMNSFNHYAYGAIGQWMYERIAGLAPDPEQPGYKHFFVRPLVGGPLEWVRAELDTPYGKAASGWKRAGGTLSMEITVPPNTTATIEFPDGRPPETVAAGTHRYEMEIK